VDELPDRVNDAGKLAAFLGLDAAQAERAPRRRRA